MNLNPKVVMIAAIAIAAGYLIVILSLSALVLIMHDGEATREVVNAMTNIIWASLGTLSIIVTGHQLLLKYLGSNNNNSSNTP